MDNNPHITWYSPFSLNSRTIPFAYIIFYRLWGVGILSLSHSSQWPNFQKLQKKKHNLVKAANPDLSVGAVVSFQLEP